MRGKLKTSSEPVIWLVNVVSGLLLVVLLPIHMFLTHIGGHDVLAFDTVRARLSIASVKAFYVVTTSALLIHGWTGVRGILLDLEPTKRQISAINLTIIFFVAATLTYAIFLVLAIG